MAKSNTNYNERKWIAPNKRAAGYAQERKKKSYLDKMMAI